MAATFSHYVEYGFDGDIAVDDVIASLRANDALLREVAAVLEGLAPGLIVESTKVAIREVSQTSPLKELFALALILTYQKELETEVPALIEEITGVHISDQYDTLVTILVMLIAVYGVSKLFERLWPRRKPQNLENDKEKLLLAASERTGLPPAQVDAVLEALASGRSRGRIENAARRFFQPVIGKATTGIRGYGDLSISPQAIAELPSPAMLAMEEEQEKFRTEPLRGVKIVLHATDRDHAKSGWAGHIVGVTSDRIKMILDKDIKPERLFGRKQITGDVLMVYEVGEDGEETPREFHLLSIGAGD